MILDIGLADPTIQFRQFRPRFVFRQIFDGLLIEILRLLVHQFARLMLSHEFRKLE